MANQTAALIEQLSSLGERLSSDGGGDQSVRNEALLLSRRISASLEQPQNVAVDLAFSVRPISLLLICHHPSTLPPWYLCQKCILTVHSHSWLWLQE